MRGGVVSLFGASRPLDVEPRERLRGTRPTNRVVGMGNIGRDDVDRSPYGHKATARVGRVPFSLHKHVSLYLQSMG